MKKIWDNSDKYKHLDHDCVIAAFTVRSIVFDVFSQVSNGEDINSVFREWFEEFCECKSELAGKSIWDYTQEAMIITIAEKLEKLKNKKVA